MYLRRAESNQRWRSSGNRSTGSQNAGFQRAAAGSGGSGFDHPSRVRSLHQRQISGHKPTRRASPPWRSAGGLCPTWPDGFGAIRWLASVLSGDVARSPQPSRRSGLPLDRIQWRAAALSTVDARRPSFSRLPWPQWNPHRAPAMSQ